MGNGGDYLRFSTKELLADINHKIDALTTQIAKLADEYDRRLLTVEARVPLQDDLNRRFMTAEANLTILQERVAIHTSQPHHAGTAETLATLRTDVDNLERKAAASEELRKLTRWLWGLGIMSLSSTVVGIAGLLLGIHR
jgi:ERCC4-type nuclease